MFKLLQHHAGDDTRAASIVYCAVFYENSGAYYQLIIEINNVKINHLNYSLSPQPLSCLLFQLFKLTLNLFHTRKLCLHTPGYAVLSKLVIFACLDSKSWCSHINTCTWVQNLNNMVRETHTLHPMTEFKGGPSDLGMKISKNTIKSSLYSQSLLIFIHKAHVVENHPTTREIKNLLWPRLTRQSILT